MSEVTGRTLKFIFGSEIPVKGVNFDNQHAELDSTTTATLNGGTESVAGRAKRAISVTAELYTAGGVKVTGSTLGITIATVAYKATSIDYDVQWNEADSTTTSTDADSTEVVGVRRKGTTTVQAIMYRETADQIAATTPVAKAVVLTFATGVTVTGNALIHQESLQDEVNGLCTVTLSLAWQGVPTEANIGAIALNTEDECEIIYETGAVTNKEITGTAIFLQRTISCEVNGDAQVTYNGFFNGAIEKAVYAAE